MTISQLAAPGISAQEKLILRRQWVQLAPREMTAYDCYCNEAIWWVANVAKIDGFWAPDEDEGSAFEDQLEKHNRSYIVWE